METASSSAANDIGSFEGSVSAEAPGSAVDVASLEAGASNAGMEGAFGSGPINSTTLDLGMPTFVSSPMDFAVTAAVIVGGVATVAGVIGGNIALAPMLSGLTGLSLAVGKDGVLNVIQDSAVSAGFAMGMPGAFFADSQHITDTMSAGGGAVDPYADWGDYWRYMGITADGGSGGSAGGG